MNPLIKIAIFVALGIVSLIVIYLFHIIQEKIKG